VRHINQQSTFNIGYHLHRFEIHARNAYAHRKLRQDLCAECDECMMRLHASAMHAILKDAYQSQLKSN